VRFSLLAFFIIALPLHAATITPSSPTNSDVITARTDVVVPGACALQHATTVNGMTVRTTLSLAGCFFTPPFTVPVTATFGPLAPGTYTYEVYRVLEGGTPVLVDSQPFVITAAPTAVPVMDPRGVAVLAAILIAVALRMLFR
jgi:hypothetical protein